MSDDSCRPPELVGVVGAGTMGVGIAIVSILAGYRTVLQDMATDTLESSVGHVDRYLRGSVARRKLSEQEQEAASARLVRTMRLDDLRDCTFVIEAIPEDLDLKKALLRDLDASCPGETIVATNTSTLSISRIASGSSRPERVVGMHFCNPAPLMPLVEVGRGLRTSDTTLERTLEFTSRLGKKAVVVADSPGFIVNRLLIPFENDSIRLLEGHHSDVDSIDQAVQVGLGYPMGPFRLLDIVGLDVHRAVSVSLFEQLREPSYAPPPLVDKMIDAGWLGRKTGKGFYTYDTTDQFGA